MNYETLKIYNDVSIGELTNLFYEEALKEFGNHEVAISVTHKLVNEYVFPDLNEAN